MMLDPKDYPWHVEVLGSEEEFINYVKCWLEMATWADENILKGILDDEEKCKPGITMWATPWGSN